MSSAPHILVVEDEIDLAELITYHLVKNGYQVTEAHDGQKALDLAAEHNFDLILRTGTASQKTTQSHPKGKRKPCPQNRRFSLR